MTQTESATSPAMPTTARRPAVSVSGVTKVFGNGRDAVVALDGLTLDVADGEFLCLLGASGCGKSTLLALIAGLEQPTAGAVTANGATALLFQDAALFPWLTVQRNVDLALRLRGVGKDERAERVSTLLELVRLTDFAGKRPHELSGGMRQRVALARALAQDAPILLMDEPFGALDAITRDLLHEELERIWQEASLTVVFVTHNVREAVTLGDRVALLSSRPGRIVADLPVDVARPRRNRPHDVAAIVSDATELLRAEVQRHGRY